MRITALTLHGFKSFGNRTRIELADGITAVVGPNGSGKSNIIDALRWATGGGRASEFRADDKTELIFHGAAGKRGLGYAEVEVELHTHERRIKVRRSLARDGSSKLKLNGRTARFLDVDDALAGSGLGRAGLSIIGQGEVSGVLMADPERLLQYVAEAAGVARLAGRREQTENRLASARTHLERLDDVLAELGVRLEQLAAEADDARREQRLAREALQLRFTAAHARQRSLATETGELGALRDALQERLAQGREALAALATALAQHKGELEQHEARYREALAAAELKRGNLRVAETRLAGVREQHATLRDTLSRLQREQRALAELRPPEPPAGDPEALQGELQRARHDAEHADATLAAAQASALEADRELRAAERAAAEAATVRARQLARLEELQRQRHAAREALEALPPAPELDAPGRALEALDARHRKADAELAAARERLEALQRQHANAAAEALALARAADRQRAAFEARRGYAQGPRNALQSGVPGVLGSVADLIRVPDELQTALGAALGRRAEQVVVDSADTARRVLAVVRERGGWVTLLPLELVRGEAPSLPERIRLAPGVLGAALDLIEVEARFAGVLRQLLGTTTVVGTLDQAVALARAERGWRPRLVTLDGELLEASGAMSGGKPQQHAGVLGAAAELEEAERAAARAETAAGEALAHLQRVQARTRQLMDVLREVEAERARQARALAQAREEAAARERSAADLHARLRSLDTALAELQPTTPGTAPAAEEPPERDLDACRARAETAGAARDEARRRADHARARVAELDQALALLQERQRSFHAARAQHQRDEARREALAGEIALLQRRHAELHHLEAQAQEERDAAEADLPRDLSDKERAYRDARQALRDLEARHTHASERQAATSQELEDTRLQLARREAALDLAREELQAFPAGLEPLALSERAAKSRLREVENELEALGPVNHRAAHDHEEQLARFQALEADARQAQSAVDELHATLTRLDRETSERLDRAIDALQERFHAHVKQLFGPQGEGGIDVLRDEEPDPAGAPRRGRPLGLRIRLQPPGKQTQSLNLLSVGERTMGAMAFLFALMGGDGGAGLPVAVLDEVDAPLDEANIRRYTGFLAALAAAGTQFILITHQKATFEVADTLWGVTTEGGVSRVFSIARDDRGAGRRSERPEGGERSPEAPTPEHEAAQSEAAENDAAEDEAAAPTPVAT